MHARLAPGESLGPGAASELRRRFEDPRLGALLLPLQPRGEGFFPRTARRYLAAWDARFLHPQNYFAPATRVVLREPLPGHRNAEAAPLLADMLTRGLRVDTAPDTPVDTPIGSDLETWVAWAGEEGEAWGRLAARDARFRGFLPVASRAGWWRHNVLQVHRRGVEILQAARGPFAGAWLLHVTREAAWTAGCLRGLGG